MTDERKGLPSASGSARYHHCRGSFLASRGLTSESTPESESGTKIHAALATFYRDGSATWSPTEAESDCFERCIRGVDTVLGDLGTSFADGAKAALIERRLWLTDENGEKIGSGAADLVVMLPDAYLIFDFKTSWGETQPAESNMQLRSLAALLRETLGDDKSTIYASIIAPHQTRVPSVVRYDYDASMVALRATVELFRSVLAGGPRTAGDHCKYCAALGNCETARQYALRPLNIVPSRTGKMGEGDWQLTPAEDLALFLDRIPFAEDVIAAAKAEAKRRLNLDPESLPGYRLKPGAMQTTIRDLETVFARFIALGGTQQQYLGALSAGKEKLSNALREATGLKGEALQEKMEQLIAGCTEAKQKASSLERIRP